MTDRTPRVLVTLPHHLQEDFFTDATVERLESIAEVEWNPTDEDFTPDELADRLSGIDVVMTGWGTTRLDGPVLRDAEELSLMAHTAGSVATYVSEELFDRGVTVCSANRPMARYVAELTLGHMIAGQRGIVRSDRAMRDGRYDRSSPRRTLIGSSVGLVGLGTVGRYLLRLLAPFEVAVKVYDPYVPPVNVTEYEFVERATLESALETDVVSIHASRTPETVGLIGAEELARMPDGALLVNTARAAIVDEEALHDELASGRIRAAIDVYHEEPLPADDPLRSYAGVHMTPHIGGHGPHPDFADAMVAEVERFVDGRALQHEIPRRQADRMTR